MARRSISVNAVKEMINRHIALSTDPDFRQGRRALARILESVLHETGNYQGFRYLDVSLDRPYEDGVTDDSRVNYY